VYLGSNFSSKTATVPSLKMIKSQLIGKTVSQQAGMRITILKHQAVYQPSGSFGLIPDSLAQVTSLICSDNYLS
jgi:hypothetical protein